MRTVGIDLATQARSTAASVLEWDSGHARLVHLELPADDDLLVRLADGAAKVGVDCPLGWPDAFVEFVRLQRSGSLAPVAAADADDWRRGLANRRTDDRVRAATGLTPLSVSTDRIGLTAMRAVRLQLLLSAGGHDVDRSGRGLLAEVYPAAGLKLWGLPHRRYKGPANLSALGGLVDQLLARAPWLGLGGFEPLCRAVDHAFDAVVAALLARATALGLTHPPGPGEEAVAATEGWIAVPHCGLEDLPYGIRS